MLLDVKIHGLVNDKNTREMRGNIKTERNNRRIPVAHKEEQRDVNHCSGRKTVQHRRTFGGVRKHANSRNSKIAST